MSIVLGDPRTGMSVSAMRDATGLFELISKHEGRHTESGKEICVIDSFPDMNIDELKNKSMTMHKLKARQAQDSECSWDTESTYYPGGINLHIVDEAHIDPNWKDFDVSKHPKSNRRKKSKAERQAIKLKRKQKVRK